MQSLKPNAVVENRFEIVELLGSGGMGVVYKARQLELDRLVALKFLLPHLLEDEQSRARIKVEAEALSSLNHPNICLFYSYSVWHGRSPYIAMEYMDAPSLSEVLLAEGGRLSWRRTLGIVHQICKSTAHAHRQGIIHRDLKPSNIFVIPGDSADRVKVTDFGLAKIVDDDDELKQKLTKTGLTLGSPHYMSPEQARAGQVTGATDIYALGCIMYECLFGRPPFDGQDAVEILYQHQNGQCLLPSEKQATDLPRGILEFLKTALAKDPGERFQSMDDTAAAIEKILSDSQNIRDAKSRFSAGGHRARNSVESRKSKPKKITFIALACLAVAAAAGATLFLNSEFMQTARLDSALQAAHSQDNPCAAVKLELQQAELYQKSHQNDKEQEALANLARDLSASVMSDSYRKMTKPEKSQFLGSGLRALTAWKPSNNATADLLFFKVSLPTQENDFAAVLHICLHRESSKMAYSMRSATAKTILKAGTASPYRQDMIRMFERTANRNEMPGTDSKWVAEQIDRINDAARRGSDNELADDVSTLYFYYCLRDQGPGTVEAMREALAAINRTIKNRSEDSDALTRVAQLYNDTLSFYYAPIGDEEAIAFHRNAIANGLKVDPRQQEPIMSLWRISLADALAAQGKLNDAQKLYEETIRAQFAYDRTGIPTDIIALCQVSLGDVFFKQKKWQQAADSYTAAIKSTQTPRISSEHGFLADNQRHVAYAEMMGAEKYATHMRAETDSYLKAEPPEDKDACWKPYSLLRDRGFLYNMLGQPDKAMFAYDHAFRYGTYPDHRAWIWFARAQIYARANKEAPCLAACEADVNEWKTRTADQSVHVYYTEALLQFARAQRKFGHLERAKDILLAADADAQHLPADQNFRSYVLRDLASLYVELGDTPRAIETLNRLLQFDQQHVPHREQWDRGAIAFLKKDYTAADLHFRRALYGFSNWHAWEYPPTLTELARVRFATGDDAEAKRLLKIVLPYWEVHNFRNPVDTLHPDYLFALSHH